MSDKALHIVHFVEWFPNEEDPQLGVFILKQIQSLSNKDAYSSMIYVKSSSKIEEEYKLWTEEFENIKIYHGRFKKSYGLKRYQNLIRYKNCQSKIIKTNLNEQQVDLVHVHVIGKNTATAIKFAKQKNAKLIHTEHWHGWSNGYFKKNKIAAFWMKQKMRHFSMTLVPSLIMKSAVNEFFPKANVKILSNVVDYYSIKKSNAITNQILTVADLDDEVKNVSGIIIAFEDYIKRKKNKIVQLHIIGDGPDRKELENLVKRLDLTQQVLFLGRLDNSQVLKCYHQYDFFISNSNIETFGVALAEAIMSGIPVISTKSGGPDSFINDNNGILIERKNHKQLTSAIEKLNETLEKYPPQQVHESVLQFSTKEIGNQLFDIYRNL